MTTKHKAGLLPLDELCSSVIGNIRAARFLRLKPRLADGVLSVAEAQATELFERLERRRRKA